MKARNKRILWGYLFILPNFIGFALFLLIPIVMGLGISFTDYRGMGEAAFVGISNYKKLFSDQYFIASLKHNLYYTLVTVPATVVLAVLLAQALNIGLKSTGILKMMYFFPTISSMVVVGILWSLLFNPVRGPVNQILMSLGVEEPPGWLASTAWAMPAVCLVSVWKSVGYYMIMVLGGMQSIPAQLYEAAVVDGAGSIRKFFHVTLPLLTPTLFMVIILSLIGSFQVFDLINIMTEGGPGTATNVLVYRIYQEGFVYGKFGYSSAMAYILFLIIMIITAIQFWFQKRWVVYME